MKKALLASIVVLSASANAQTITTVAGTGLTGSSSNGGPAITTKIGTPISVAADAAGNFYMIDGGPCQVKKITAATGIISAFVSVASCLPDLAGTISGDGGPATAARLHDPKGIVTDGAGNVYIADYGNKRVRVVNSAGIINTFAGPGVAGTPGDGGPATAADIIPNDVAVDGAGNVYVADKTYRIRKIMVSTGIITTIAGNGTQGSSGDGGLATAATVDPVAIALDAAGNIYFANGTSQVRKINASTGIISNFAGNGSGGVGDGGPATTATLNTVTDLAVDGMGNVYIAENAANVIRKVNSAGTISTVAGNRSAGYAGDGGPAISAQLYSPAGIAVDAAYNLFIADMANQRIRKVTNVISAVDNHISKSSITISPNPVTTTLYITGTSPITNIAITNVLGQCVYMADYYTREAQIAVSEMAPGIYFVKINNSVTARFVKQ